MRTMVLMLMMAACGGQGGGGQAAAPVESTGPGWWCAHAVDGTVSNCERAREDCDRMREAVAGHPFGACAQQARATCFHHKLPSGVALECLGTAAHCDLLRRDVTEHPESGIALDECVAVE